MGTELPFTPFEELMLAQESDAYPCDIWVRMPLHGRLNRPVFEASVTKWLANHPLLACKAVKRWSGHQWVQNPNSLPIYWKTSSNGTENVWPSPERLSLLDGKGIFLTVTESPESDSTQPASTLCIQFHHAMADGLGIIQAIHELWLHYDSAVRHTQDSIAERSHESLVYRNRFGLSLGKIVRMLPQQWIGLAGVRQFLMRRPVPLVPHQPPTESPSRVTTESITISSEEMEKYKRLARKQQMSVNELLAAALFEAISIFRNAKQYQSDSDWLRMMVPMSMRTTMDLKILSACNVVSAIFLDRTPAEIRDRLELRRGIHEEMELIKNNKLAFMFLFSVWIRKILSWGRHNPKTITKCETSFVFSNLGKVFYKSPLRLENQELSAGGIPIKNFEILAPLNPFMVGAITFVQYGKRAQLTLRYDDRVLPKKDAVELMVHLRQQIELELETDGAA